MKQKITDVTGLKLRSGIAIHEELAEFSDRDTESYTDAGWKS